jgi:hypothetical protein
MSLTTNKACVPISAIHNNASPGGLPGALQASQPSGGDFWQASARLAHIRSSQVPVPSFSSPTAPHYCSSHCQPHRRPALLSANTQHHHYPSAITVTTHTHTRCRLSSARRPLSSLPPPRLDSISLSLPPPSSPRRTRLADRIPCLAFAFARRKSFSYSLPWLANRPLASTSRLLLHIRLLRNGVESMHAPPPTAG